MDGINKQKFLAELSRLLTFMYEEDRQEAIALYSAMFDEAEDEEKLIQLLMSPTRQAVIVARAYNQKDRKLQVTSQSREEAGAGEEGTPDFAAAIEKVREDAFENCGRERADIEPAGVTPVERLRIIEENLVHQPVDAAADNQIQLRFLVISVPYALNVAENRRVDPV